MEVIRADLAAENLSGGTISQLGEESVVNALKIIFTMIGLRPQHLPIGEEQVFLHNYILSKYGHKTPKELIFAFDLAIQDQLDIDDVKVYDQFTCEYFAKIMNGYRKWLKKTYELKKTIMQEPVLIEEKKMTNEDKAEWLEEWKNKDEINVEMIPLIFYDYLNETKKLSLTNRDKYEYFDKAAAQIKSILYQEIHTCKTNEAYNNLKKFEIMEKNGFEGDYKISILNRAKRMIVYDYLKK